MKRIIGALILLVTIFGVNISLHEQAHSQVAKMHGCIEVKYVFHWTTIQVECLEYAPRSEEVMLQEAYLQSLTEIVGYHSVAIIAGLLTIAIGVLIRK